MPSTTWDFYPKIIFGKNVNLEPLEKNIFEAVCTSMIPDTDGWYAKMFGLNTKKAFEKEFSDSEQFRKLRSGMGFAIRDLATSEIAGISFFLKMDPENRSVEIGSTNIAPRFRKTHINTNAKLIMLQHAFEDLNCIRVSFRCDEENLISKKAIERLGAVYGGRLRHERILPDGRIRNYLFYSIVDSEWPQVKSNLIALLDR